jgi:Tfp pilus assembly protein PilV
MPCAVNERGLTLAEVLVATVIIAAGFLAILTAFPQAMSGVQTGNDESTATFLAQQKLESLRAAAVNDPTLTSATFNNGTTTEGYGSIPNGGQRYQRVTTVTAGPTPTTKRVTVTVTYRSSLSTSSTTNAARTVTAATVLSARR